MDSGVHGAFSFVHAFVIGIEFYATVVIVQLGGLSLCHCSHCTVGRSDATVAIVQLGGLVICHCNHCTVGRSLTLFCGLVSCMCIAR